MESLGGEHNVSGRSSTYGDTGHETTTATLREGTATLPAAMQVNVVGNLCGILKWTMQVNLCWWNLVTAQLYIC